MATTATRKRTTTRKTTPAKSTAATRAKATTEAAATSAELTARQAQRTAQVLAADTAYAVLGLGDRAVEIVRTLPDRANAVAELVRSYTVSLPDTVKSGLDEAASAYSDYATRGRKVVGAVRTAAPTRRAVEQTKIARSQVKAATTSVRKAVSQGADAVDSATDKVGATA